MKGETVKGRRSNAVQYVKQSVIRVHISACSLREVHFGLLSPCLHSHTLTRRSTSRAVSCLPASRLISLHSAVLNIRVWSERLHIFTLLPPDASLASMLKSLASQVRRLWKRPPATAVVRAAAAASTPIEPISPPAATTDNQPGNVDVLASLLSSPPPSAGSSPLPELAAATYSNELVLQQIEEEKRLQQELNAKVAHIASSQALIQLTAVASESLTAARCWWCWMCALCLEAGGAGAEEERHGREPEGRTTERPPAANDELPSHHRSLARPSRPTPSPLTTAVVSLLCLRSQRWDDMITKKAAAVLSKKRPQSPFAGAQQTLSEQPTEPLTDLPHQPSHTASQHTTTLPHTTLPSAATDAHPKH